MSETIMAALVAVGGSVVLGLMGLAVTWGVVRQMVRDLKERLEKAESKIDRLQDESRQMPALAAAIEHMGQKFADAIQNLAVRWNDQNGHMQSQLADIKRDQGFLRDELGVRRRRAERGSSVKGI
jgi:hypothetical protein